MGAIGSYDPVDGAAAATGQSRCGNGLAQELRGGRMSVASHVQCGRSGQDDLYQPRPLPLLQ